MTLPITSPFRWAENPRPSIFGTDPHFTGKNSAKAKKEVDLTPKPSSFSVAIATKAESDRTNSIRRTK